MILKWAGASLGIMAILFTAGLSSIRLDEARDERPMAAQVLYLPSGSYLKFMSLGFPELMADMIFIWSIQFYANYEADERFAYLEHIYANVISELDPEYVDPYLIGSLIMSVEAKDNEMALRLLDKGIAANPDEWILPFEAGFTAYHMLHDYKRAARYFDLALQNSEAPSAIRRMYAEMFNRMGDKRSALAHWLEIYEAAGDDYIRDISWRHVHDLRIEVDIESLEAMVAAYREAKGRNPSGFAQMVSEGTLTEIPLDPDGEPYSYDPQTGRVRSQSRWRLYRKAGR